MILVIIFVSVILSCPPLLLAATYVNTSMQSKCPESFSCPDFGPFKFPFYNTNDTRCGLIKVDCISSNESIQLGGQSYGITGKDFLGPSVSIQNSTFQELVVAKNCEALMNNFTSPSPDLFSISIKPLMTLFKCPKPSRKGVAYFDQPNYNSYNLCKHHNFYYKHPTANTSVPGDLPHSCQVIQLKLLHFLTLVLTGSAFILLLSTVIFIIYKNNLFSCILSKDKSPNPEDASIFFGVSVFSYTELENATKNFDPSHELGDGGFGAVYYGKLQDGREIAVKKLYDHNYKRVQQFMNEVEILTKLRHPHLVLLYGCTSRQSRELLLVYEYISNGTVADHLHGEQANPGLLTWPIRMKIAIETASALVYLHASEIIHRDVKTNNILLDHNFCVKVADFGLSRLVPNNVTHVSTAPQGTPGYLDPQYHQRYQLTDKSDVYSFGVVLIELISSMAAVDLSRSQDEISLAYLALNRIQGCAIDQLIDPVLGSESDPEIKNMITSVAELAFRCLQFHSEMRPTMNEVLEVLMEIKAEKRTDAGDSINDTEVLLKDSAGTSPVSVTCILAGNLSGS